MNPFERHAAAMAASQSRMECPVITWGDTDYTIVPGSAARRKDLAAGGFQLNADFRFEALVAQFLGEDIPSVAALKDVMLETAIDYLGDSYKVTDVRILPGGLQISVDCNSLNQNA